MIIKRQRGRMIRQHYRTMAGCACKAWCDGYIEGSQYERARAKVELVAELRAQVALQAEYIDLQRVHGNLQAAHIVRGGLLESLATAPK